MERDGGGGEDRRIDNQMDLLRDGHSRFVPRDESGQYKEQLNRWTVNNILWWPFQNKPLPLKRNAVHLTILDAGLEICATEGVMNYTLKNRWTLRATEKARLEFGH